MKKFLFVFVMWFAVYGFVMAAVNINTATKEELTSLKGIGEKRAQEIINYRTKNGPFKSIDELEKVPGIGPGIMKQIRSEVTVSGKTTVDKPADASKAKAADTKGAEAKKTDTVKGATKPDEKSKTEKK
jgi:competence protein ComEA